MSVFLTVPDFDQFIYCLCLCLHLTCQTILTYVSILSIIFPIPEILDFNRFPIYFFKFQEENTIIFILISHITNIYVYTSLLIPTCKLIHGPNNGIFDQKKVAYLIAFQSLKICSTYLPSCLFLNSNIICVKMLLEFSSELH